MLSRRGFTLIELLVVIAIIAILAAILFPVFSQAKAAAKKSVCLSNARQIATGMHLYMQDADDVTPTTYTVAGKTVDIYQTFQPYLKNMDVFFCPEHERHARAYPSCDNADTVPGAYVPSGPNADRCLGIGYNWGFGVWAGGALVGPLVVNPDGTRAQPGVSATAAERPAELAAFGDTYNGRRYTMSAVGSQTTHYTGPPRNSGLRHGGRFNYAYLDGHAKSVAMAGHTFDPGAVPKGNGYVLTPADSSRWAAFYCLADATVVDLAALGSAGAQTGRTMGCKALIDGAMAGTLGLPKPIAWPG